MELGFGAEYDSFRAEVCAFVAAHWPPIDGDVKSADPARRDRVVPGLLRTECRIGPRIAADQGGTLGRSCFADDEGSTPLRCAVGNMAHKPG